MRLGPYQIGEQLGAGGMGEVYRARDTRLDRTVAIKIVPAHLAGDAELRERFEREARTISSLNHPNVCTLYDVGRENDIDFLVMEYLDGQTLASRLEKGPLPLKEALEVAMQIADGLDKAHRQGVVHRDLKPGNVMLTKTGAKLLDFGLSKQSQPVVSTSTVGRSAFPTGGLPLTAQGAIVGTLQYMAPEQLEGIEADTRTDIFAFGSMLHEMVTGRKAFEGKSQVSLIAAIVDHDPPPVSSLQPVSPPLLDHLVKTCLAKNPDKRWQTMADVLIQLKLIAESGGNMASPAITKRIQRQARFAWIAAAALLIVTAAITAAWMFSGNVPTAGPTVSFEVTPPSQTATNQFALSPTGSHVVAIVASEKAQILWVRALAHLNSNTIPGTEGGTFPFWSPDGRFIGFFADNKLKKVDLFGAPPQIVCDAGNGAGGTWNGDNVIVFAPGGGPLFRVTAAGGVATPVTQLDTSKGEILHRHPYFLPDGRHFLYTAISSKPENSGIYVGSLDSSERKFLLATTQKAAFSPPGYLLFMRDSTLMAQQFDSRRLELNGDPFRVAEELGTNPGNGATGFTVSNNGELIYKTGGNTTNYLRWLDRTGKDVGMVGARASYENPALSPDLQRIAVSELEGTTGDIWILDLMRGTHTRFTFDAANDNGPLWSPDGNRIVFQSNRSGISDFYQKNSNGVGQEEVVLKSNHEKTANDWSADGRFLLYQDTDPKTRIDLWVLPMSGDKKPQPVVRSPFTDFQGRFSPDGKWIAYVSNESGRPEVYIQSYPEAKTRVQISTSGGYQPLWRHDGKELFFLNTAIDAIAVDISTSNDGSLKAGIPHKLFSAPPVLLATRRNSWEVTPDGQRFLFVSGQQQSTAAVPLTVVVNWLAGEKAAQ
jgi:eukaryotic-like serine/threonine-protein kinase